MANPFLAKGPMTLGFLNSVFGKMYGIVLKDKCSVKQFYETIKETASWTV